MKITPYQQMLLENFYIEKFCFKVNRNIYKDNAVPIYKNLDLKIEIYRESNDNKKVKVIMFINTSEKSKSIIDFEVEAHSLFFIKDEKECEKRLLITMIMVTYSTLRGFLMERLPIKREKIKGHMYTVIPPLISTEDLLNAIE